MMEEISTSNQAKASLSQLIKWQYPWISEAKIASYDYDPVSLHQEIIDYFNYMCPTRAEHVSRIDLIERVQKVVSRTWPNASFEVFGSSKTGLYLPTSDIDLCVSLEDLSDTQADTIRVLHSLRNAILSDGICSSDFITVLEEAQTPIIKCTDRVTLYKIDIGINLRNHSESAKFTAQQIRKYPQLPYLLFVLKQFLSLRQLLEVYTGGINSYSLVLMIVNMLQLHPRKADWQNQEVNLGVLLIEFFELYGKNFNHERCTINVLDGGFYEPRCYNDSANVNCKSPEFGSGNLINCVLFAYFRMYRVL